MKTAIYWFKRDLRVEDNRGLKYATKVADQLIPIFIIDPKIFGEFKITSEDERAAFVFDILQNLNNQIEIFVFYDETEAVFQKLLKKYKVDFVITSEPLTVSGRERVNKVEKICNEHKVKLIRIKDNLLVNADIDPNKPFYRFYEEWVGQIDEKMVETEKIKTLKIEEATFDEFKKKFKFKKPKYWGLEHLDQILEYDFARYNEISGDLERSSKVSPYLRMGIISIRKLYNLAKRSKEYIRQLCWREYYYQILKINPSMLNMELKQWARKIEWSYDEEKIRLFKEGKTGYPIIDAGIKELKERKWIHNRMRLLLGSFLTKNLGIDWRVGERFFKEHLIDYDEALNVGNWQWVASVGVDYQNFRYFNPIIQAKKFDKECKYIKKYIPELSDYECKMLHDPLKYKLDYHPPLVDYEKSIKKMKSIYAKALR